MCNQQAANIKRLARHKAAPVRTQRCWWRSAFDVAKS